MTVGVLAMQGAFAEHEHLLETLNEDHFQIRKPSDLDRKMDGLILPGGESTVIGKLLTDLGMMSTIKERITEGLPVFGTCAGLILLSEKILNDERTYLGTFPISVKRNAFGRQLGSFTDHSEFGDMGKIPMEFIRAPVIEMVGEGVTILSRCKGQIVAARFENQLVTAFHPELTSDRTVHKYFLDMIYDSI